MVDLDVVYEGDLHCSATHRPSSARFATDAPVDNQGRGESFSPTDLVGVALGTCMVTTMGILARKKGWAIEDTRVHVRKGMTSTPPRRIERLEVRIEMPKSSAALDHSVREELERAAHTCPVRISLLLAIEVPVEFVWPAQTI